MRYIKFQALSWSFNHEIDEDDPGENSDSDEQQDLVGYYTIHCYGRNEKDKNIYLKITGFTPHFYVKIPEEYEKTWSSRQIDKIAQWCKDSLYYKYKETLIKHDVVKRHDFYGFRNGKKFKFIRLIFNNYDGMRKCSWLFNKAIRIRGLSREYIKFKLYESNLEPLLRFYHIKELKPTGWLQVDKKECKKLKGRFYNTDYSYTTDWKNIQPVETSELAPFKIMAYDIECISHDGINFPMSTNPKDKIAMICATISRLGESKCFKKIAVVLGSCAKKENAEVRCFKTERELLLGWRDVINEVNPDIITGYNTFGFDEDYIYQRCKLFKIDRNVFKFGKNTLNVCEFVQKELSSAALGDNKLKYFNYPGIINFDVFKIIQRDHSLGSYKLDSVSENFINGEVLEILPKKDYTLLKITNAYDLELFNFIKITQDGEKFMNGKKFKIIEINDDTIKISNKINSSKKGKYKWGLVKDDMPYSTLFKYLVGTNDQKKLCLDYCFNDCSLLNLLIAKLQKVLNNIAMSNVTLVPLSYIFLRGQGIKTQSKILEKTRRKGYLVPVIRPKRGSFGSANTQKYEGATVFTPKKGFYKRPIAVLDYASLYPSSIIMKNLSHETWVSDPDYDNLPGVKYYDVKYKNPEDDTMTHVRFAKLPDEFGIVPEVLQDLLSQRKLAKKKKKEATDPFQKKIYDGVQLALKVTANSVYGAMGASVGPLFCLAIAAGTTSTGREMLELARDYIEKPFVKTMKKLHKYHTLGKKKKYKKYLETQLVEKDNQKIKDNILTCVKFMDTVELHPETIYGDSVSGSTPLLLKRNDKIFIESIENLEIKESNTYTWTEKGWTLIKNIICHKLSEEKKMLKIHTHTGIVKCTSDHSLVNSNGNALFPSDVIVGKTKLMQSFPVEWSGSKQTLKTSFFRYFYYNGERFNTGKAATNHFNLKSQPSKGEWKYEEEELIINTDVARIMGMFMGDGSCGKYDCKSGTKCYWAINNSNYELLETYRLLLSGIFPKYTWKILNTLKSSNVYKLVCKSKYKGSISRFVIFWRALMYNNNQKQVPECILNSSYDVREYFWNGLHDSDGTKKALEPEISQKGCISSLGIYTLLKSLDYDVVVDDRKDKPDIYRLRARKIGNMRKVQNVVKKIEEIPYEEYVYDLTTDNHHFHAGIGNIIVHNTDSIFVDYKLKWKEEPEDSDDEGYYMEKDLLEKVILLGVVGGDLIKKILLFPQDLEYEKTFYPWFILSKKRYVGNKYEFDANHYKQVSMGIVLKRRDNANIVKRVIGGLVDILLNQRDIEAAIKFMKTSLKQLLRGDYDIDEFITTKTLRGRYKGEKKTGDMAGERGSWAWDDVKCSIAHVKLCQRMKERDPGNAPQSNDRIAYVAVYKKKIKGQKMLQGDKIETPDYIAENDLPIDYLFYLTNQIMKPAIQFLELLMDDADKLFKKLILKEKNKREGVQNIQKWFGKAKKKKVSGIEENIVSVSSESDESIEIIPDDPDPAVANSKFVIKI